MKLLSFLVCMIIFSSCAQRGPASLTSTNDEARDSMALGNIQASASKTKSAKDVCFDVQLSMKGIPQKEALASNWTVAWVDKDSKFHLLSLNQRDPASEPKGGTKITAYGAWEEWTNNFRACAPDTRIEEVKSLVLTPKELSYKESDNLTLEWK